MTGPVAIATAELKAALATVNGAVATTDPGGTLAALPALVIGPPRLVWQTGCVEPTEARYLVWVVVDADERAIERLWDLVVEAGHAIDAYSDAVVIQADPAVFPSGTAQLPAYELQVEVPL